MSSFICFLLLFLLNLTIEEESSERKRFFFGIDVNGTKFELPECTEANFEGLHLRDDGEYDEAMKVFSKCVEDFPDCFVCWQNRGTTRVKIASDSNTSLLPALSDFKKAYEIFPESPIIHYTLGTVYHDLGNIQDCMKHYERCIELLYPSPDLHSEDLIPLNHAYYYSQVYLAEVYADFHSNFERAFELLTDAISFLPEAYTAYLRRSEILHWELHRLEEAIHDYDKMLQLNPYVAETWRNRGTALGMMTDNYEAALVYIQRCLDLEPLNRLCLTDRAQCYKNLGMIDMAIEEYERILEDIEPTCRRCMINLANTYRDYKTGYDRRALRIYDRVIELNPGYANGYFNRGKLLRKIGASKEARKDFLTANNFATSPQLKQKIEMELRRSELEDYYYDEF